MVQKRETKAIDKLCVREILSLSFGCGAYFFEFRGRNLVCFVIAYNFNGKYAPEARKTLMRTAFFTRANYEGLQVSYLHSTIDFGVRFEAWHLVFQHLEPTNLQA